MKHNNQEIFLSRTFTLAGEESVTAHVYLPYKDTANLVCQDYKCEFQIYGLGSSKVYYAMGVDEIQAVYLALMRLGSILYASDEYRAGLLKWFTNSDLGLPMPAGANGYII